MTKDKKLDAGQNLLKIQRAMGIKTAHKGRNVSDERKNLRENIPKLDTNVLSLFKENHPDLPGFISEFKVFKQELMSFDRDVARVDYSSAFKKARSPARCLAALHAVLAKWWRDPRRSRHPQLEATS